MSHPPRMSLLHGSALSLQRVFNHPAYPPREIHRHKGVLWHTPLGGADTHKRKNADDNEHGKQKGINNQRTHRLETIYTKYLNLRTCNYVKMLSTCFLSSAISFFLVIFVGHKSRWYSKIWGFSGLSFEVILKQSIKLTTGAEKCDSRVFLWRGIL